MTDAHRSLPRFLRSLPWLLRSLPQINCKNAMLLFTATGEINLILLSQEEVVLKVTSLSGEYDIPITEERRDSRLAAAAPSGTMSSREEEACPPDDRIPEANFGYAGAEYCGPFEQELELESREEYRRLQDYLACYHQSPVPVSHTLL